MTQAIEKTYVRHSERHQLRLDFLARHAPAFESGLWKITDAVDDEGRIHVAFSADLKNRLSAGAVIIPATDTMKQCVLFTDQYGDDNGFQADLTPEELTKALLEQAGMRGLTDRNYRKENKDRWTFVAVLGLGLWIYVTTYF